MGAIHRAESASVGGALFGATRQAVLRTFFSHPGERFYQRQIIQMIGLGSGTVQRELYQLARAGIITRTVEGRQTYFQTNQDCPVFDELRGLIRKTFGVAQVLREALNPLARQIRIAFVFGSIAEGDETAFSDIDVMVISARPSLRAIVSAFADAQRQLRREVNPSIYGVDEFCRKLAAGHHFLSSVFKAAKIFLIGNEGELSGLVQERMAQGAENKPARNRRSARRRRS